MNQKEYQELVKSLTPKEKGYKNSLIAFIVGGLVGVICTITNEILIQNFSLSNKEATIWTVIFLIGISSLLTALGFFDRWVKKAQCGLIIPTSGFAHSITSSALDYKRDGLITGLGSNFFKLAGSVILYGVLSAFILTIIKVVFYG